MNLGYQSQWLSVNPACVIRVSCGASLYIDSVCDLARVQPFSGILVTWLIWANQTYCMSFPRWLQWNRSQLCYIYKLSLHLFFTTIEKRDLEMHSFYSFLPWISLRKYLVVLDQKSHITKYPFIYYLSIIACLLKCIYIFTFTE